MTKSEALKVIANSEYVFPTAELTEAVETLMKYPALALIEALLIAHDRGARDAHNKNIQRLQDAVTGFEARIQLTVTQ